MGHRAPNLSSTTILVMGPLTSDGTERREGHPDTLGPRESQVAPSNCRYGQSCELMGSLVLPRCGPARAGPPPSVPSCPLRGCPSSETLGSSPWSVCCFGWWCGPWCVCTATGWGGLSLETAKHVSGNWKHQCGRRGAKCSKIKGCPVRIIDEQ